MAHSLSRFIKEHSLILVLLGLLTFAIIVSWFTGKAAYNPNQHSYLQFWAAQTIFSLVGNLGVMTMFVYLTKHFIEKGSAESKE